MEGRIREFTIIGEDAWHEVFLYTTIEEKVDGQRKILVYYGGESHSVSLSDEGEWISRLQKLERIDNKSYEFFTEDGWHWSLRIAYDSTEIISCGVNVLPLELYDLFASIGLEAGSYRRDIVKVGRDMGGAERIAVLCDAKAWNRYLAYLWSEPENNSRFFVYKMDQAGRYRVGTKSI